MPAPPSRRRARIEQALSDIRSFCAKHANKAQAERYRKFFTEGYDPYGIPKDTWEANRLVFFERYRGVFTLSDFLDLGDLLWQSGKYEEASFAITTVEPLLEQFDRAAVQRIGGWLETGVRNWAHVDVTCGRLVEPCLRRGVVKAADMAAWARSESRWKRRAAAVSLLALLPDGEPLPRLLSCVEPLMTDPERVVHQGTGWFLREAWKARPAEVEAFLARWKDSAPRLIIQYATEKMTPAARARFRREKRPVRGR